MFSPTEETESEHKHIFYIMFSVEQRMEVDPCDHSDWGTTLGGTWVSSSMKMCCELDQGNTVGDKLGFGALGAKERAAGSDGGAQRSA